jgi:hypothetical protein
VIDELSSAANAVHFNPIWQAATPSVINAKCYVPSAELPEPAVNCLRPTPPPQDVYVPVPL